MSATPEATPRRSETAAAACVLLILNSVICWRLFFTGYTSNFGSIEGTFVAMTRVMAELGSRPAWWPLWNGGSPFEYAYFPLLPAVAAFVARITGSQPVLAFHMVSALAYALGPVTVFALGYSLLGDMRRAWLAGALYSLWSPACLLFGAIRHDSGWDAPRRLFCLVYYGEYPHIAGLTLVPLAWLFLYRFLLTERALPGAGAVLALSAVALTNSFASVTLAAGVLCMLLAGLIPWTRKAFLLLARAALIAYLLISPWLPPSFLRLVAANPAREGDVAVSHRALALVFVAAGMLLVAWLAHRQGLVPSRRFCLVFGWFALAPVALYYWTGWTALPQPGRYQLEFDLGVALLGAAFVPSALLWRNSMVATLAVLAAIQLGWLRHQADQFIRPANLAERMEYRVAQTLARLAPQERVMAGGSATFWLNAFTDSPQLDGGHAPTAPNWTQQIARFTIYEGTSSGARPGVTALLWMKAMGVGAFAVSEAGGKQALHSFHFPEQFRGLAPELWRDGSDVVYRVPSRSTSLAHVVPLSALVDRQPRDGLDTGELERYVSALDNPALPLASLHWESWTKASIETSTAPGQAISLQMNSFPGWQATVDGEKIPVTRDGLGWMVVHPARPGAVRILFEYTGGAERNILRWVQGVALLFLLGIGWSSQRGRNSPAD